MATFVVRVWVPDRPGAFGAVASRIGAVGGDLIGIDILERGGGRAIDELVVELAEEEFVARLLAEMGGVDGVDVEDIRLLVASPVDARLDALETAASLVGEGQVRGLLETLARSSAEGFVADWSAIVGPESPGAAVTVGPAPPVPWLQAFVAGSRASTGSDGGPEDVAWTELAAAGLVLVLGRRGRPWRVRERRQLVALARIADHRWSELSPPS